MSDIAWLNTYGQTILAASAKYRVKPALIAAVIQQESGGNPNALSPAGAKGLMQVVGGSYDPATNIDQGTAMLRQNLDTFGQSIPLALAAYNAGPGAVKVYGGIPPFAETQAYVPLVIRYLNEVFTPIFTTATDVPPVDGSTIPAVTTPATVTPPLEVQTPSGIEGTLQGVANAIAGVGTTVASPFVTAYNTALQWMTYFGQKNIYVRILLIIIGVLLLLAGVILFALSFVDKGTAAKVSTAMAL